MRSRCNDPSHVSYHKYGGRGIAVCSRWNSFDAFLADMGVKPSPDCSIDRINNDGNYEPDNCCWATPYEQTTHTRWSRLIEYQGQTLHLSEWARRSGVPVQTLFDRLARGLPMEEALIPSSVC
jgi:hypothetical protein